jgi:hypothetical protein
MIDWHHGIVVVGPNCNFCIAGTEVAKMYCWLHREFRQACELRN